MFAQRRSLMFASRTGHRCFFIAFAAVFIAGRASAQTIDIEPATHAMGNMFGEGINFKKEFTVSMPIPGAVLEFDFVGRFGPKYEVPPEVFINGTSPGSIQPFFPPLDTNNPLWQTNSDGSHDYNGGFHVSLPVASLLNVGPNIFEIRNGVPEDHYFFNGVKITAEECPVGPLTKSIVSRPNGRDGIIASFVPKDGLSLAEAALACDCDHFNFRNRVREPDAYQVRVNGQIVKASGELYPEGSYGFLDPVPGNGTYALLDPRSTMPMEKSQPYPSYGNDANESYWDDNFVVNQWPLDGTLLEFRDSPSASTNFFTYEDGDYTWFFTELVGVDSSGRIIKTFEDIPGTSFNWISNQLHDPSGSQFFGSIYRSTDYLQEELPAIVSGGIQIVPEPSGTSLRVMAAVGLGLIVSGIKSRQHNV